MKKILLLLFTLVFIISCSDSLATSFDDDGRSDATVDEDVGAQDFAPVDEDVGAQDFAPFDEDEDETVDLSDEDGRGDDSSRPDEDETVDETVDEDNLPSNELCTYLFGRPNENTGLDMNQCKPV